MNASILVLLLAAVTLAVDAEQASYKECAKGASFQGLLDRVYPVNYNLTLDIASNASDVEQIVRVKVGADDSKSQSEEPKNVIVLNAGNDITIGLVKVLGMGKTWPHIEYPLRVVDVCRDFENQLLVIRTERDFASDEKRIVVVIAKSPIRSDGKAIFKQDQMFETDFSNSQAHLSISCFDDPKYETTFYSRLVYSPDLTAKSNTLTIQKRGTYGDQKYVDLVSDGSISLGKFSFELRPDNN